MTTSADRRRASTAWRLLLASALTGAAGTAMPADRMPEPEFLEYLGMWEASDDEWLLAGEAAAEPAEARDETDEAPPPADGEPAEKVDEQTDED